MWDKGKVRWAGRGVDVAGIKAETCLGIWDFKFRFHLVKKNYAYNCNNQTISFYLVKQKNEETNIYYLRKTL